MQKRSFTRTPLAAGVALALGVSATAPVSAQDGAEDQAIEEIVVTGIRGSLQSAQAMKENSDTFVDGVTASDIGALPDRSVAEALQRVPGVNVSRFKKTTDPDRFSVEGADVIIRGLPFVRSELNGRDVFSANGGIKLSFNDVSPELLGSILVYKNATADMIEGGIAGSVDLVTRKPLDTDGLRLAGSAEYNYGDISEEGAPTVSFLGSNNWETAGGRFGLQFGYAQSELNSRSYASQVTDPCYRADTLDGPCLRAATVDSAGFAGPVLGPDEFPPADTVIVPKGGGVRTTGYERDREAFSLVGQWESDDGRLLVTAEYLRAEADLGVDEHAILALVNNDVDPFISPPESGSDWTFNNGSFESGTLSQVSWRGLENCVSGSIDTPENPAYANEGRCLSQRGVPTETLRFQRKDRSVTEDLSLAVSFLPTDNLSLSFEAQYVDTDRDEDGFISAMATYSDIFVDVRGSTPDVQFMTPGTTDGSTDPNYFTNPDRLYNWFLIDNQILNEGDMSTLRADLDYHFSDDAFIRDVKFGARWSDRNRINRDTTFGSNWGSLGQPWAGEPTWAGGWENKDAIRFASDPLSDGANSVFNPFRDFQRGETSVPVPGGAALFFGGEDMVADYFSGLIEQQADAIRDATFSNDYGVGWNPLYTRTGLVEGTPFLPGDISDVGEQTEAAYIRVDFGVDGETPITGNFGVRYVKTTIESAGLLQFPIEDARPTGEQCLLDPPPPGGLPGYCFLSSARSAEFLSAFTGETIDDGADIEFDHWLPSLNVKIGVTDDFLIRAAVSKGISRPDLAAFQTGGGFGDNTNVLRDTGTLETGPLFTIDTGNRLLRPVEAWSYDLSAEWYFDNVGSLTMSLFKKDFDKLISRGSTLRTVTSDTGTTAVVEFRADTNVSDASMEGFELAYQQTFDFLPEPFNGLGAQATYTYIDASDLVEPEDETRRSPFAEGLSLAGVSEDTVNLTAFYETDAISARLAWNWRSDYLITPRDDIFPFSPIMHESTGQLDGSFFYNFNDFYGLENFKVGVMAVNLLDEVAKTRSILDYDGTTFPRSAYRFDRRFTLVARFEF
jgi:TonB-dependent receptor